MFLKVKEFPLHLYVESRHLLVGGPALVDFFGTETGETRTKSLGAEVGATF